MTAPTSNPGDIIKQGDAGFQHRLQQLPVFARELIAGGLAGGLAKTCVAPLERTKILFQTGRLPLAATVPETLTFLWRTEGMYGLFKGNTASVARIVPYAAIHFSTYEYYRRLLLGSYEGHVNPGWDLLAGSAAGATAVLLTYPMDLIRAQLAWQTEVAASVSASSSSSRTYKHPNIRSTATNVWKSGGFASLFRGIFPTLMGILPYAGLKFYVYQSLKHAYRDAANAKQQAGLQSPTSSSPETHVDSQHQPLNNTDGAAANPTRGTQISASFSSSAQNVQTQTGVSVAPAAVGNDSNEQEPGSGSKGSKRSSDRLPVPMMLLFGGISGLVGQTATYPLDVVRRRMQVYGLEQAAQSSSTTLSVDNVDRSGGQSGMKGGRQHGLHSPAVGTHSTGSSSSSACAGPAAESGAHQICMRPGGKQLGVEQSVMSQVEAGSRQRVSRGATTAGDSASGIRPVSKGLGMSGAVRSEETAAMLRVDGCGREYHLSRAPLVRRPCSVHNMKVLNYAVGASATSRPAPPTTWSLLREIVREGGVKALYRGLSINYMKVVPSTAIGFTVYDALKAYLDLKNNL